MKKTIMWFVGVLVAVVLGVAVVVIVKGRENEDAGAGFIAKPPIEEVAAGQTVENAAKDFSFSLPATWYLERNDASGVALYPDYDPKSTQNDVPACKIEISPVGTFSANANHADLNDWVTQYVHKDSTMDTVENSRSAPDVSGAIAVEWRGAMNGATTTLVYASTQGKIFEIAPSTLLTGSNADNDDCLPALQDFLSTLQF